MEITGAICTILTLPRMLWWTHITRSSESTTLRSNDGQLIYMFLSGHNCESRTIGNYTSYMSTTDTEYKNDMIHYLRTWLSHLATDNNFTW